MRLFAILLLLFSALSYAFEPLNTDDAGTVPKNMNQIEQYYFRIASHGAGSAETDDIITPGEEYFGGSTASAFPFTYTRGITENIEISFGSTYYASPRGSFSPFSNKVIALKWRFAEDENGKWAMAIKPSITLPGTSQQQIYGLNLALPSYGLNFIGSHYWETTELHINAMYTKSLYNTNYAVGAGSPENRTNILFFSIAPVWRAMDKIRLALDMGITTNPPSNEQYLTNYALLAAIFSIDENLDIGLSYMRSAANMGQVINNAGINTSRSEIGFTWRF